MFYIMCCFFLLSCSRSSTTHARSLARNIRNMGAKKRKNVGTKRRRGTKTAGNGQPVRTKDGNFYNSSVRINKPAAAAIRGAHLKGPMSYNANPAASTNFNRMTFQRFLHGQSLPRGTAFYKLKNMHKGQFCLR